MNISKELLTSLIHFAGFSLDVLTGRDAEAAEESIKEAKVLLRSMDAQDDPQTHFIWQMNLYDPVFDSADGDSNETSAAKALIHIYRDKNGIADEMTFDEIDFLVKLHPFVESAAEVLRARDII